MGDWRRHAIYFAPPRDSALARFGAEWLGWDPEAGVRREGLRLAGLPRPREALTEAPRRYGFHATIKPPFRLSASADAAALDAAIEGVAGRCRGFDLPALRVGTIGRFVALAPEVAPPELAALAEACVTELDRLRAPPDAGELARRRAGGLDPVEEGYLRRWGYPYVLDRYLFHLTLTGPLPAEEIAPVRDALAVVLAPVLRGGLAVREVCRFAEAADGYFHLLRRFPLGGG